MHSKVAAKIISISVALIVSVILSPGVACGELGVATEIMIEDVVVNEPTVWVLELRNNNLTLPITVQLTVLPADVVCSVEASSDLITIEKDSSQLVDITYLTSETGLCSRSILVFWWDNNGSSGMPTVIIHGNAREANKALTVAIDGRETGVVDRKWGDQLISEWIAEFAANAKNHGEFVSRVAELTDAMKKAGEITGKEKGMIQSAAAKAKIP